MKLLYVLLSFISVLSCNVINPDEQEPSFIQIDNFAFHASSGQGSSRHNISDVWVYANDDIQGVYDVPADIPVIRSGNTKITVFAGIKNDGIGTTRIRYPFYTGYDTIVNLEAIDHHVISPHFEYVSNVLIDDERNFENARSDRKTRLVWGPPGGRRTRRAGQDQRQRI